MPSQRKFLAVGSRVGRLTVVASPSPGDINTSDLLCDCGETLTKVTHRITATPPKACITCANKMKGVRPHKFLEVGQRIGSLIVTSTPSRGDDKSLSDLVCICGKTCSRKTYKLRHRSYGTCGCGQKTPMVAPGEKIGQFVFAGECKPIDRKAVGKHGIFVCHCGRENVASFASVAAGRKRCRCTPNPRRKPDGVAEINTVFSMYRSTAISKGRQFTLSIERFRELVTGACHYCGVPPRVTSKDTVKTGIREEVRRKWASRTPRNGIDRVDNSLGYADGNVVSCCAVCNRAKREMSKDEFISWIDRAAAHLGLGRGWAAA